MAMPPSVQIGGLRLAPATLLAPMAGVTDTVFRRFIRNLGGCGLIMTEFTSADGVLRGGDKKAKRYLHFTTTSTQFPHSFLAVTPTSFRRQPELLKAWALTLWT